MRSHLLSYLLLGLGLISCSSEKVVTSTPALSKGKVLVIVSSENELALKGGKKHPTGYYLNELTLPVRKVVEGGYEVVFADPQGNPPAMDANSDSPQYFGNDQAKYKDFRTFHDSLIALKKPRKLSDIVHEGLEGYSGVFFPGGHAPMVDLLKDPNVSQVLRFFHEKSKPTALICHGPIALLATLPDAEKYVGALAKGDRKNAKKSSLGWPYAGYKMTLFSTAEEKTAEKGALAGKVLFYPEAALRGVGGVVQVGENWQSNVVQDRELITGQNPQSDDKLSELFVKALDGSRK